MRTKLKDGTTWPNPACAKYENLMWRLANCHGSLGSADLWAAAEVMEAYASLIAHPPLAPNRIQEIKKEVA